MSDVLISSSQELGNGQISTSSKQQEQDEIDAQEGLALLLGGLSACDISSVEECVTKEEEEDQHKRHQQSPLSTSNKLTSEEYDVSIPRIHGTRMDASSFALKQNSPDAALIRQCYERAFSLSPSGRLSEPPVRIVDMSHYNRGYASFATRDIRRGEVIYTERAAEACQMPYRCSICDESRSAGRDMFMYRVRGCQYCFRSLEPASSIVCKDAAGADIPMAEYWPVPEYQSDPPSATSNSGEQYDLDTKTGRVQCMHCQSLFCSKQCLDNLCKSMGSCCHGANAIKVAVHAASCAKETSEDDGESILAEPAITLAARMFSAELYRYRRCSDGKTPPSPFLGMCGDSTDIDSLELGILQHENNQGVPTYSLEGIYASLCSELSLNDEEMIAFPLSSFERLSSVAARNGFNITTQSPFRAYYSGMTRANGGRNSDRHKHSVKKLARALGSPDGELKRDMDREVEEKCAVQIAALFTLTARINHSCDPCAELRGGEFVDCHVDLVARRGIEAGEEITISYLNLGKTAGRAATDGNRRRRELKARYLFDCDCCRCTEK
mmetsp:Transcript_15160/g.32736  ORF Transcript_15160/g.32736 Transcript_15160/m.32736 type:complete len:554 (+) Transcript_15160:138-1799(+)